MARLTPRSAVAVSPVSTAVAGRGVNVVQAGSPACSSKRSRALYSRGVNGGLIPRRCCIRPRPTNSSSEARAVEPCAFHGAINLGRDVCAVCQAYPEIRMIRRAGNAGEGKKSGMTACAIIPLMSAFADCLSSVPAPAERRFVRCVEDRRCRALQVAVPHAGRSHHEA